MKKILKTISSPAIIVFIALLGLIILSFFSAYSTVNDERTKAVSGFFEQKQNTINERLDIYAETLRFGVGLFSATESVTKESWKSFIDSSTLLERYPGGQGIGYSYIIKGDRLDEATNNIKNFFNDRSFKVYPEGNRDEYTTVIYLEPNSKSNAQLIGYDMFYNITYRNAMTKARDTGDVYMTQAGILSQASTQDEQSTIIMYAPQYTDNAEPESIEERQKLIRGYVFALFSTTDFLGKIFENNEQQGFQYRIYDPASPESSFYETSRYRQEVSEEGIKATHKLDLYGASWQIDATYNDSEIVIESLYDRPRNILISGIIFAALIAGITWLLLKRKADQLLLEKERSVIRAKDGLLSIASHQLRTPATGVKQYIGLLTQGFVGELTPNQTRMLEKAYESNERQLKTINDILYLAKLDAGRIMLARKPTNISSIVASVIEDMAEEIHSHNHTYTVDMPKKGVVISVDEHMVRMIIENLLSNAIKYMPSGGHITIKLSNRKQFILLSVGDTGVGIKQHDIDSKLFKEFSRIPNKLSKTVTGTGVGLYLVKHLVELHGGEVRVESEFGKGSTFSVEIPKSVKS